MRNFTLNRLGLSVPSSGSWFSNESYLLNSVAPSMIHDYAANRYWNSAVGSQGFPFTATRTGNATMFDSAGRLVYAPANMITQSSMAGAVVGVVGSGGALPTGWAWASVGAAAITREVVAVGPDYIDVRMYGSNTSGGTVYPSIFLGAIITAVVGQPIMGSVYAQLIAGSLSENISYGTNGKLTVQFVNSGAYVSNTSASNVATSTMTRLTSSGSRATADHNQWRPYLVFGANNGDVGFDFTIRLSKPQFEYYGPDSPKDYVETTGTAYYGPRLSYDPHTGVNGILLEQSRTNLCPKSGATGSVTGVAESAGTDALGWATRRFTADGATTVHFAAYTATASAPAASTVHTISAIVKMISGTRIQIAGSSGYSNLTDYVNFNLSNGTVVGTGGTVAASSITAVGSGFYRISMTFTTLASTASGTACALSCIASDSATRIPTFTSSDVFDVIGAQMEVGYGASSYIPTFYAAATRASDLLTTTSISWLNQALGTWYIKFTPFNAVDVLRRIVTISDGTVNNAISSAHTTSKTVQLRTAVGGTGDFTPTTATNAEPFTVSKFAYKLSSPNKRISLNGAAVVGASVAFPTSGYTTLQVGGDAGGGNNMFGYIHELRYYPSASASDGQLQALTT